MNCNFKKYIYGALALPLIASCSDDIEVTKNFLNGSDKSPIAIQTNLSAEMGTRATDKKFEAGDVLLAYIEAGVTTAGTFSSADNPFKGLQTLTLTAEADNTDGDNHKDLYGYDVLPDGLHITETEDAGLQKLYWDNYSSTEHDLRATGAGIRLKYGYCYNGGNSNASNNTSEEAIANGTLTWTISNQTTAGDFKKADLLFAKTQTPVSYTHGTEVANSHGILVLPYSHAMSKITVVVTADKGFEDKANFTSTALTLKHMQTKVDVNAPAGTVTVSGTSVAGDIATYKSATTNKTATFQAIVAPGTNLSVGNFIATIANVDGNNYEVPITTAMLEGWKTKLTEAEQVLYGDATAQAKPMKRAEIDDSKGYLTQSGVHYVLNVVLDKQTITVRATLADWDKVTASANAQITFNPDVTGKGEIATALQTGGFDVYKSPNNTTFSSKSTTLTYADSKWSYSPTIYWAGQSDKSFFRALSPARSSTSALAQGGDILWGTSGDTAITPRTGDVPLNFEHLMSKLGITLKTVTGDAAVDLTNAKIQITNMATTGTFSITDGSVSSNSVAEKMFAVGQPSGFTQTVIPQTIGNDAKVIITLADRTTYSVQLNQCKTNNGTAVSAWIKGKNYNYTITLSKQEITFSATVKNWVEEKVSGDATLDWD